MCRLLWDVMGVGNGLMMAHCSSLLLRTPLGNQTLEPERVEGSVRSEAGVESKEKKKVRAWSLRSKLVQTTFLSNHATLTGWSRDVCMCAVQCAY